VEESFKLWEEVVIVIVVMVRVPWLEFNIIGRATCVGALERPGARIGTTPVGLVNMFWRKSC
jgi:hypothetical protein